jgi:hypothetical protein
MHSIPEAKLLDFMVGREIMRHGMHSSAVMPVDAWFAIAR